MTLQFFLSRILVGITKKPYEFTHGPCTQDAPHLEVVENHLKELKGWMGWIYPPQVTRTIMDSKFRISVFPLGAPHFQVNYLLNCGRVVKVVGKTQ